MMSVAAAMKADVLKALSDPNRIRIVELLQQRGEMCNCEMWPELGMEQSNLSRHLKVLTQVGILEGRKQGLRVHYRIAADEAVQLLELAEAIARGVLQKKAAAMQVL